MRFSLKKFIFFLTSLIFFVFYSFLLLKPWLHQKLTAKENLLNYLLNHSSSSSIAFNHLNSIDSSTNDYKINPKYSLCNNNNNNSKSSILLFLTFVVISADSFEKRAQIRSTWANRNEFSNNMKLLFTLGESLNETINRHIFNESISNGDILQINNFIDSYFNMTKKIMLTLKWINIYCENVKYILRINDDVILNTYLLIHLFNSFNNNNNDTTNQIYGLLVRNAQVDRNVKSKFYINYDQYKSN